MCFYSVNEQPASRQIPNEMNENNRNEYLSQCVRALLRFQPITVSGERVQLKMGGGGGVWRSGGGGRRNHNGLAAGGHAAESGRVTSRPALLLPEFLALVWSGFVDALLRAATELLAFAVRP